MGRALLLGLLAGTLRAQEYNLNVVPLQSDPEQIAHSLREHTPLIPEADCVAFDLWECHADEPKRSTDVSLRWVQLDDDPELEAVIVLDAAEEDRGAALVFDKQGTTWNLVGTFWGRKWDRDVQNLIRVGQLTKDSPRLLWVTHDLGGSGSGLLTTEMLQLRAGKFASVLSIAADTQVEFPVPRFRERQRLLASDDRIVIHTIHEQPPGRERWHKCEVRRWDATQHTFVAAAADQAIYCDAKTGKPNPGKAHEVFLPYP